MKVRKRETGYIENRVIGDDAKTVLYFLISEKPEKRLVLEKSRSHNSFPVIEFLN